MNQVMLDVARADEMVKCGMVKRTVKVLIKHVQDKELRTEALTAITKVAQFNAASISPMLDSWEKEIKRRSPDEIPMDVQTCGVVLRLENYSQYGGGTALEATNWMVNFSDNPDVVKHALQCLRSKAWDPQRRLEFQEVPSYIETLSKVIRQHHKHRE